MNSNSNSNSNSKLLTIMAKNNNTGNNNGGNSNVNIARVRVPVAIPVPSPQQQQLQVNSSSPAKCVKQLSGGNDCSTQLLMENFANFKRSGVPARFMYYEDGSWIDFSPEAFGDIRSGFAERKAMVEVQIGTGLYLFDFYRMLQIDLVTADQRSVAWIDVHNRCFFPKRFIDGGLGFSASDSDFACQNPVAVETGNGNGNVNGNALVLDSYFAHQNPVAAETSNRNGNAVVRNSDFARKNPVAVETSNRNGHAVVRNSDFARKNPVAVETSNRNGNAVVRNSDFAPKNPVAVETSNRNGNAVVRNSDFARKNPVAVETSNRNGNAVVRNSDFARKNSVAVETGNGNRNGNGNGNAVVMNSDFARQNPVAVETSNRNGNAVVRNSDFARKNPVAVETGNGNRNGNAVVMNSNFTRQNPVAVETGNGNGNGNAAAEEGSSSDYRQKIEIVIQIGEDQNSSSKRKRDGVKLELEDGTEGSCSNYEPEKRLKKRQQVQKQIIAAPTVLKSPRLPRTKLLKEGDQAYEVVKNLFVSSLDVAEHGEMVTTIHQCVRTDPLEKARYQAFLKQLNVTNAARGDANMQFAWYGTSAEGVSTILAQGFRTATKISGRQAHGIGIYLSPIKSSYTSAMLSDPDENGEKHVLLCRVILGRYEQVEAGSQQSSPSSMDFDSGVDDINNPKWHVVWCANMNTHIIPECVVSYKVPSHFPGRLNESPSSFKLMPDASPAIFSPQLLSKLGNSLPPSKALQLHNLSKTYKERKVAKDVFEKQLRAVVGDDRLLSAIREYHPLD